MVAVPAVMPVTTPEAEPILATLVLLLTHVPPEDASLSVVVPPTHTELAPVIAGTEGAPVTDKVLTAAAVPQLVVSV